MKSLFLVAILLSSQVDAHSHAPINSTLESAAGWSSLVWNGAELGFHAAELFGFKPALKPPCTHSSCNGHPHVGGGSKIAQAYHIVELTTHGLNLFDTTAKMFDSVSETIEEYCPPAFISASAFAFNTAVIAYRIFDAKKLLEVARSEPTNLAAYGFTLWGLIDAVGHAASIYMAAKN